MHEARALGLHMGSARIIAERVADEVATWVKDRDEITEADLARITARKIAKYNKDLSYVYKHRDKII